MLDTAKKITISFFLLAALLLALGSEARGQVGVNSSLWNFTVRSQHHGAIVQVDSSGGMGTGVIIRVDMDKPVKDGFQGYCLTAYHVVENDKNRRQIRVTYQNGRRARNCLVVASDKENDVALLWVWVPQGIMPANVADEPLASGKYLEISGLGGGSDLDCCIRHFVTQTTWPTNDDTIFADVALLPGDSGGPAFNDKQQVVGIVSGGWFWFDGKVKNSRGKEIKTTWPARLCNVAPIHQLLASVE